MATFRNAKASRNVENDVGSKVSETHLKGIHEAVDTIVSFMREMKKDEERLKNTEKTTIAITGMYILAIIGNWVVSDSRKTLVRKVLELPCNTSFSRIIITYPSRSKINKVVECH